MKKVNTWTFVIPQSMMYYPKQKRRAALEKGFNRLFHQKKDLEEGNFQLCKMGILAFKDVCSLWSLRLIPGADCG